jgi:hypothetical protein
VYHPHLGIVLSISITDGTTSFRATIIYEYEFIVRDLLLKDALKASTQVVSDFINWYYDT